MDLIDKKIICELDMNCRSPVSKIAKNLRISRNVAAYRIKNLEDNGIIRKYICSINLGLLGYKTYKIFFKIWSGKECEKEFVKNLIENKQIIHFLKIEGPFDYSIAISVKNISELNDFLMHLKNRFKDLIKDYLVSIVVYSRVFKLNKLLLDQKPTLKFEKHTSEDKQIKIDEKDIKILHELSQSANTPIVELAERTKLSVDIIKYRLKLLSKNLINSYRVLLDFAKLGYYHYVIMLRIKQATKYDENKLLSWCSLKKNVLFCTKRIGYFDFSINVAIKNINDFNKFISELKSGFGDMIDSYDVIINSELLKLDYIPF